MKSELVKRSISSLFLMGLIFVTALINDYIFLSILFIVVIFSWIEWIRVIEKIKLIEGWESKTSSIFVNNFDKFMTFYKDLKNILKISQEVVKKSSKGKFKDKKVSK